MSSFTKPLILKFIDYKHLEVTEEFDFWFYDGKIKITIEVHCGFITDLASVPRIFWPLVSPFDKVAKPAVIHDYLYRYGIFERKKCDDIFLLAMKVAGVPRWKRFICYYAVRLFGYRFYNRSNYAEN